MFYLHVCAAHLAHVAERGQQRAHAHRHVHARAARRNDRVRAARGHQHRAVLQLPRDNELACADLVRLLRDKKTRPGTLTHTPEAARQAIDRCLEE